MGMLPLSASQMAEIGCAEAFVVQYFRLKGEKGKEWVAIKVMKGKK